MENSKAIVLLDEIEKAHPDVLTVFLQVFDDGRITDPKVSSSRSKQFFKSGTKSLTSILTLQNGTVHCKDAVFIMTSNLAADKIREASPMLRKIVDATTDRPEEYSRVIAGFNRTIHPILKKKLKRDEFLGRINQIVVFLPLNEDEVTFP